MEITSIAGLFNLFSYAGLDFIAAWWLFLLWKKTRESAFFWLMLGIGVLPVLQFITRRVGSILFAKIQQSIWMNHAYLESLMLFDAVLAFACIAVGLWKMGILKTHAKDSLSGNEFEDGEEVA